MTIANSVQNPAVENATIDFTKDSKYQKEFSVTTDAKIIIEQSDIEIAERAKTFKLAGFRQGAVPISIVKRQIGESIIAKHINQTIQRLVIQIAKQYKVDVSGVPSIDIKAFEPEKQLVFSVKFNIMPSVPKIDLTSDDLSIEVLKLQVNDDDVQQAKNALIKMIVAYKDAGADYEASYNDGVILDFVGTVNGEEFEGNKAIQIRINIGEGQFIKDFEDKLVGVKKGDEKIIHVKFPADYHDDKIAGKDVDFKIKVHEILVVDGGVNMEDELKKRFGVDTMEKFEEIIKEKIINDFDLIARLRTKKMLFDKIDTKYDFELPEHMIDTDFNTMWNDVSEKIAKGEIEKTDEEARKELMNIAKRRVKLGLILADVAKSDAITIDESDFEKAKNIEKMKRPDQQQMIDEFFSKQENQERVQGAILEEKIVDFIISKVPTKEVVITTAEFNEKYAKEIQELIQ